MASAAVGARPTRLRSAPPLAGLAVLLPVAIYAWLRANPAEDASLAAPVQHFFIVSGVSVLAFSLAILLAIAALQIAQYRALFLCLGFMAMGGIFAVHGLSTPGILGD